jgi:pleckstrin family protein A (phosphoinositide binding specific) protein 8
MHVQLINMILCSYNLYTRAYYCCYRGLQFIKEFLLEIVNNQQDLSLAAGNAYSKSLKPYHGWVVRGVFAVSIFCFQTAVPKIYSKFCLLQEIAIGD